MKKVLSLILVSLFFLPFLSCKTNKKEMASLKKEVVAYNYTPAKPVNGKLKGIVELGMTGFNLLIVEVDEVKNWELKEIEYGSSLISEGMTNTSQVNLKLKEYIEKMMSKGIGTKDIHFVVSSGAIKEDLTQVILKELENYGYDLHVVTPKEEAKYALQAYLPEEFKETSFVVDIGSGNTKFSYREGDQVVTKESYGSKYYQKGVEDIDVYNQVKEIASTIPTNKRKKCFLIGGAPHEIASTVMKGDEKYISLSTDVSEFEVAVDKKGKKAQSGLNIYKAILDATSCEQVIFINDGNFIVGYLLELPY